MLMSVRAMSIVWESPIKPPSLKLATLALADWSNDQGSSLHPSMAAIARKVGVSRCQAQRLVQTLKSEGLLSVVANAHGGAPGSTPQYHLHLDRISTWTDSTDATGSASATGITDASRRVAPMHKRGSTHATQTTMNHQYEPSGSESDDSGVAADASPMSAKDQVWTLGPALLGEKARGLLGKLVATHGEDLLAEVLSECAREKPGEPKAWIVAACAARQQAIKPGAGAANDLMSNPTPQWALSAGFTNRFEAENAGCTERNFRQFAKGQKVAA
jgi:hypothetical protein